MKKRIHIPKYFSCPICRGLGYQQRTDKRIHMKYKCWSCLGKKIIKHPLYVPKVKKVKTTKKAKAVSKSSKKVKDTTSQNKDKNIAI